jgi:F-type H+-transporting ATPase subunit c
VGGRNLTTTKRKKGNKMEMLAALEGNFIPFAAGLAGLGGAIGVGLAGAKGAEAVGRNPGAFGKIFTTTLIAMALAEGIAILGFFVLPGLLKGQM